MAHRYGWLCWHVPAPMRWNPTKKAWVPAKEGAGLPDLILLHDDPPRLVFLELKAAGGKLSDRQKEFLQAAKTVADYALTTLTARVDGYDTDVGPPWADRPIGVFAAWPEDEAIVEQMLKSKVVA
jgi:hypothetical protein